MTSNAIVNEWYPWESREQLADWLQTSGFSNDTPESFMQTQREQQQHEQTNNEANLLLAAREAVATGELTYAEAAAALHHGGFTGAHALLVQQWQQEEAELAAYDASAELAIMDASEYTQHFAQQQERERAASEAQIEAMKREVAQKQVEALQADLKSFVDSTPDAHAYAPQVEQQLVRDLQASGVLPTTPEERTAAIESALKKTAVLGAATESIRQQVDTEWRLHRRNSGARDGLMTAGDIARAEEAFKRERTKQLSDSTMINLDDLKAGPTSEEQTAALVEKYRDRQDKSTALHTQVGAIEERGKKAPEPRDHFAGSTDERKAYREAVARAEAEAQFGTPTTTLTTPPQETAQADSRLPEGWVDEFGPGGYS